MAATVTKDQIEPIKIFGQIALLTGTFTGDSSFASGGEELDMDGYFSEVLFCQVEPSDGYVFEYDKSNDKVIARFADYDAGSDGVLIEAATEDLSSVSTRWLMIGRIPG